ncbi:MAG: TetR family transcriptional regulator C-terminal domain-containing protein [Phormidesmis sp.]
MKRTGKRTDKHPGKRGELIQVGSEIIALQGFNAASLNDILSTAGVPKGSFYYYFSSKEAFGLAIVDESGAQYLDQLQRMLNDTQYAPSRRLLNYFKAGIANMKDCHYAEGCLLGNLAQELAAQNEVFRDRLSKIFSQWEQCFAQCLQAAYLAGEISDNSCIPALAKFILSGWEGAILQAKVAQSTEPMENFVGVLFQHVLKISTPSQI